MKRDLHFEVTYPHPPERVWRALTDPAAMREWLMDNTFAEARVGHQFQFRTTPRPGFNGIVYCEVTDGRAMPDDSRIPGTAAGPGARPWSPIRSNPSPKGRACASSTAASRAWPAWR